MPGYVLQMCVYVRACVCVCVCVCAQFASKAKGVQRAHRHCTGFLLQEQAYAFVGVRPVCALALCACSRCDFVRACARGAQLHAWCVCTQHVLVQSLVVARLACWSSSRPIC